MDRLAPRRTPILCRQLQQNLIKKRGKRVQEGGLDHDPQKRKQTENNKQKKKKKDYGNLTRRNPLQSKLKSF